MTFQKYAVCSSFRFNSKIDVSTANVTHYNDVVSKDAVTVDVGIGRIIFSGAIFVRTIFNGAIFGG